MDKQRSTKHYTKNERSSNTNPNLVEILILLRLGFGLRYRQKISSES